MKKPPLILEKQIKAKLGQIRSYKQKYYEQTKWHPAKRIIIMRHAQSEANIDRSVHCTKPDYEIPLTGEGIMQAQKAGKELRQIIGREKTKVFVSPYVRTKQTLHYVLESFDGTETSPIVYEEPRIREQDWGRYGSIEEMERIRDERARYGPFFYRIEHGESAADVYDRISHFLDTLHRHFDNPNQNILLVTHGLTARLFLTRWFRWTVEQFNSLQNFDNAEYQVMEFNPDTNKYQLTNPLRQRDFPFEDHVNEDFVNPQLPQRDFRCPLPAETPRSHPLKMAHQSDQL